MILNIPALPAFNLYFLLETSTPTIDQQPYENNSVLYLLNPVHCGDSSGSASELDAMRQFPAQVVDYRMCVDVVDQDF